MVVNVEDVEESSPSAFSGKEVGPTQLKSTDYVHASSPLVLLEVSVETVTKGPVLVRSPSC